MAVREQEFEFKDTGVKVWVRKVSPLLIADARTAYVKKFHPKPPLNTVDYGDGQVQEPNPADPEYLRKVEEFNQELENHIRRLIIQRGVRVVLDDETLAEIKAMREEVSAEFEGIPVEQDDKVAFISYIATGSQEDLEDLLTQVIRRSQPTEEAIADAVETFRPEVQG